MAAVIRVDGGELALRALDQQAGGTKARRRRPAPPSGLPCCSPPALIAALLGGSAPSGPSVPPLIMSGGDKCDGYRHSSRC